MSTFDAENFFNTEVQGSNSTQRTPVPEYPDGVIGIAKKLHKPRQVETKEGPRWICGIDWAIDDQHAKDVTGMAEPTVRHDLWLDVTPQGSLDMSKGKNVDLGRTREAVGLNDPSKPFKFDHILGRMARLVIKHRTDDRNGDIFAQVSRITSAT